MSQSRGTYDDRQPIWEKRWTERSTDAVVRIAQCNTTFTGKTTYSTGSKPRSLNAVDVNGDGKLDIIVANYGSNNVGVLLNIGNGTFTAQTTYSTGSGSNPYYVAATDVNGDGKPDIIVANYGSNNEGVLIKNC
ncbi:unnamed protein product [Rotaria socialis]|uniref:VCBS repeat-containing protein n=1 Tax=Rotaria socialis TaxID=392032 RepID=A0A821G878_9BILA|nr:unnamed protein product [Rotaria socialis]